MVYIFDLQSGQISQRFSRIPDTPFAVAFSPDGQSILSTYFDDGSLSYWDVQTGEEILRMGAEGAVHNRLADAVAFHPSGQFALSGAQSESNQVAYWDLTTGEPVWTSNREEFVVAAVYGLDISPNGKTGLTRDNYLTLWNLENGEELMRLSPEGVEWGWDVAFLDDQTAIVSEGSRMILWDLNTGTAIRDYLGHSGQIKGLALSPDGRLVVSASRDSTVILWNIATGEPLRRYYGHHDDVNGVAFSPDGREIFSGSRAGEAFRWRVDPDLETLQAWVAANRILPELSCAERQFYNIQPLCDE
jgi:WD40 repeat protein